MFTLAFKSIIFNVCTYSWEIEYWNQRRTDTHWWYPVETDWWPEFLKVKDMASSTYKCLALQLIENILVIRLLYVWDSLPWINKIGTSHSYPCNLLEKSNLVDIWFQSGGKRNWLQTMTLHTPFCLLGSGVCTFPSEPEDHKKRICITCDAP